MRRVAKSIMWILLFVGLLTFTSTMQIFILTNNTQIHALHWLAFQKDEKEWNICVFSPQILSISSWYKNDNDFEYIVWDSLAPERAKILAWHIGCAMFNRGEINRAIVIWKNHVPQSSNIFAHQSVAAFDNSNLNNAQSLAAIAEAIDDTPTIEKVKLYNRFCLFSINQQQTQDALIWCRKLAAISDSDTTRLLMGKAYYLAQDYPSAIEWLSKVQGGEQYNAATYALADVYAALGQWQKVLEILEQISHPEDKQNLLRATAWLHLGDQEKASLLLRQILKNSPQPAIRQQICQLNHDFQLDLACNE